MPVEKYDINKIWQKGLKVEGYDANKYRKDACGAWIMFEQYGKEHNYGWEVDHIYPVSRGGDNNFDNLRPLHYLNNKSKGDDYPNYTAIVSANGNRNEETQKSLTVNGQLQKRLLNIYHNKL
jgi:5-methylcytosine-specific restriction endonuclease McrA